MAGAKTPKEQTVATLEEAIQSVGRVPHQRNTFYKPIEKTKARLIS
jgi:2-iminoacetate synthase ThiH